MEGTSSSGRLRRPWARAGTTVSEVSISGVSGHVEVAGLIAHSDIKNHAWINTEFTEFIWLDSDNIPLMEPALHFESQEYQKSRSVFWSDLYRDHPLNSIWRIVGRPCSDEHFPAETGQVVFDKRGNNGLNLAVLHLANHIMLNAGVFEPMLFGDKDTWVSRR
jgi:alpha 1,2-mannosyltransferase